MKLETNDCRYCKTQPEKKTIEFKDGDKMYMIECPVCRARTYSKVDTETAVYLWNQTYGYSHGGGNGNSN